MTKQHQNTRVMRTAICTAAAIALVAGYAGSVPEAFAGSSQDEASVDIPKKAAKAVDKAELAVEKAPQDASARLALASAYLQVGRFESAASTLEDAQSLGAQDAGTALSLALAYIAAGQDKRAVAQLDQWRDSIPASDLGLALALAGETTRGVAIIADALRSGDDTAKVRQNLAYAYALDGRWREARLMASQDVSPDQLDSRISDWAMQAQPHDYRKRVAGLLGVPLRSDFGQPQHLALAREASPSYAVAAPVAAPVESYASGELPAAEGSMDFAYTELAQPTPAPEPVADTLAMPVTPTGPGSAVFDQAFAASSEQAMRFVSQPVIQAVPAASQRVVTVANTPRAAPAAAAASATAVSRAPMTPASITRAKDEDCTHLVQLGSFSSEANAERAWDVFLKRNPTLSQFDKTITRARVRGKDYWRVSAAGFDKRAAFDMCSSVKGRGHGCIAYAADKPLPGALPSRADSGQRMARR